MAKPTYADLVAALTAQNEEIERLRRKAEGGIVTEYVAGISKQGKPWNGVQIKGGVLGWRGITFRSLAQLDALLENVADIRAEFDAHAEEFKA